jgi:proline iminopeptidase
MKKTLIFVILIALLSCDNDRYVNGDFFYLVNKDAKMPIVVRGNKASKTFILFLHGGPGGTSIQKIGLPAFNTLERDYALVYWDQRASGSSQGNSADRLLTLEQFVEDLDKVVVLLKGRYDNPRIFLMGHSWGGCLGTAYLVDKQRQSKIAGWIEVDGAHNNPLGDDESKKWVVDYARRQLAAGVDIDFWNYALEWYEVNPDFTSDQMEHYAIVQKAHGYVDESHQPPDIHAFPEYSFAYLFDSPADVLAALTNYRHVINSFIISDIDLSDKMKDITIPTLIIWGQQDGIIPYSMATHALDHIGAADKSILTLHNSAHFGYYEQPEEFVHGVRWFVERVK